MEEMQIFFGGNVKSLGEGRIGGYLIQFSDETLPDLSSKKDFFTKQTFLDIEDGERKSIYWSHGLDATLGVKRIGTATVKMDDVGVWLEGVLEERDAYEKEIAKLAGAGKLGWSSGAPSHLVARKSIETKSGGTVHEVLSWPVAEASLTVCPADPRNAAMSLKSLAADLPNLLDADRAPSAGDNKKHRPIDHTTKNLPAGWSYRDLMNFLESEANEDFGIQGTTDPYGMYTPSVMVWGCNLLEGPDRFVYRRTDEPGDLFARPYEIVNNDAVWGDEQEVIETTTYVDAPDDDGTPMKSQADVTAIKQQLTRSMPFGSHADIAHEALSGFVTRAEDLTGKAIKAGRVISAANRAKMADIHRGMQDAHAQLASHIETMGNLLTETDPDAKKAANVTALRVSYQRRQARLRGIAI